VLQHQHLSKNDCIISGRAGEHIHEAGPASKNSTCSKCIVAAVISENCSCCKVSINMCNQTPAAAAAADDDDVMILLHSWCGWAAAQLAAAIKCALVASSTLGQVNNQAMHIFDLKLSGQPICTLALRVHFSTQAILAILHGGNFAAALVATDVTYRLTAAAAAAAKQAGRHITTMPIMSLTINTATTAVKALSLTIMGNEMNHSWAAL
jgi:hypothetical protein